jgi:uncharacterized membrane protein
MLNMRYGPNAWEELLQLRRKIAKQRQETIYKQQEMQQALVDGVLTVLLILLLGFVLFGGVYFVGILKGWW